MMAAEIDFGQVEWFQTVTPAEYQKTKKWLSQFRKMKTMLNEFGAAPEDIQRLVQDIEAACRVIIDEDSKKIIEMRYMDGMAYKIIVMRYESIMSESTVNRRLIEGIESVARTLKMLGYLGLAERLKNPVTARV
ncbi:hypothetical protein [Marinicrinis lubricantis]|uniref:Uncharacterized protein n=1 Tax=Marinicrinis lubricantis TaxID=2086470 RepID=A0ABW1IQ68_9BACL